MDLRPLHAFVHVLARGLSGMLHTPRVALLATSTIAICMSILGAFFLAWVNTQDIASSWKNDVALAVYLIDADVAEIEALRGQMLAHPDVAEARHVRPEEMLDRLVRGSGLGEAGAADIDPSVLPDAIEVSLHDDVGPRSTEQLALELERFELVDEVVTASNWTRRRHAVGVMLQRSVLGVVSILTTACLAIVWCTIRLCVHARRETIDVLHLLGATPRFVRGPFIVEGVLQGVVGSAMAMLVLGLLWSVVEPRVAAELSSTFAPATLRFFDGSEVGGALGLGAFVGWLGSRAAVARQTST